MPKHLPTPYHLPLDSPISSRKNSADSTAYSPSTYSDVIRRASIETDPGSVMKELLEYHRSTEMSVKNHNEATSSNNIEQFSLKETDVKLKTNHLLQNAAKKYMKNQEEILSAMKVTMNCLKVAEANLESQKQILLKELKLDQERLEKKYLENLSKIKAKSDISRIQYRTDLDNLNKLSLKNQKDYFESQDMILANYSKMVNKIMH